MAGIAQKGTTVEVGFGTFSYSLVILESLDHSVEADVKPIKDTANDTKTIMTSDPRQMASFKGIVLGVTAMTPPAISATIVLGTFTGRVTASSISYQREETILSVTAIKEDSMTYS